MRTLVVSGGTDGIGRALSLYYVRRGHTVIVLGRNPEKGEQFLSEVKGALGRGYFIQTDLSLIRENRRAIREIDERVKHVDALVLCAQHFRSTRFLTDEGIENTFALYYLSRYILSLELADLLERASAPVIVNVCGPGIEMGEIAWNDLGREQNYHGLDALMQGSRLNDLLGVAFASAQPGHRTRYVLFNPGGVATSFSGQYDEEMASNIEAVRKVAQPVEKAIEPIVNVLDNPPPLPLSALMMGKPLDLNHASFDARAAARMTEQTSRLLSLFPRG